MKAGSESFYIGDLYLDISTQLRILTTSDGSPPPFPRLLRLRRLLYSIPILVEQNTIIQFNSPGEDWKRPYNGVALL